MQLDWFGTSKGDVPDDRRTFQYAAYTAGADTLEVRLLNVDVVSRDVETSGELSKSIADHAGDPKLFRDAMSFQRVKH